MKNSKSKSRIVPSRYDTALCLIGRIWSIFLIDGANNPTITRASIIGIRAFNRVGARNTKNNMVKIIIVVRKNILS